MFMFCFFLQSGWNTAVAEQDVWNMLKVNLPLRFVLFFGEAPSRRMGALGEKKDRKNDRLIEGYKPPGNEWLSRDESSIRFPVVMFFKNNITLLACVQPQLGCNCTRATLYDLNQREAVNRKNLTACRTKMKLHCREGSVFLFWRKSNLSDGEEKLSDFFGQFAPRGHWSRGVSSRDWAIKHLNWGTKASWLYNTYVISGICHTWRILKDDCVEAYRSRRISWHSFCLFSPFNVVLNFAYQLSMLQKYRWLNIQKERRAN